jgi:hypothetical protein
MRTAVFGIIEFDEQRFGVGHDAAKVGGDD